MSIPNGHRNNTFLCCLLLCIYIRAAVVTSSWCILVSFQQKKKFEAFRWLFCRASILDVLLGSWMTLVAFSPIHEISLLVQCPCRGGCHTYPPDIADFWYEYDRDTSTRPFFMRDFSFLIAIGVLFSFQGSCCPGKRGKIEPAQFSEWV